MSEFLLNDEEMRYCSLAMTERKRKSREGGHRHRHGMNVDTEWDKELTGIQGEMVLAKALKRYWDGPGMWKADDVYGMGVRTCMLLGGCLILHHDDKDHQWHWLIVGDRSRWGWFDVRGCILGHLGKDDRWWRTDVREPAFFVPQKELVTLEEWKLRHRRDHVVVA